jgi:L-ribulose-5-phosphate 3-epimerase
MLNRRELLKQTAAVGLAAVPAVPALARRKKPFKISLAQWSFNRALFSGKMDNLDFARVAAEQFDIHAVEYVNQFFKDKATDRAYLAEMKKRAKDAGVESRLIMIDGEGALGDADPAKRTQAVENHYKWVEAARYLGCFAIRVNAYSSGTPEEQMSRVVDGLRRVTEFGAKHKISVIVENHGGLSSNGKWLADVMRRVDHPRCGTLPDFGNFTEYDRYLGVQEMMPYAKAVSAKSHDFDAAGDEKEIDYRRMMKIVYDAGYRGFLGIEYEGSRLPEAEGVRLTKALIERVAAEM